MAVQTKFVKFKISIAYMLWANLAGGRVAFYRNPMLWKHKTFTPPFGKSRLRRWLWNSAVRYLVSQGELTHTPTLRSKF